MTEWIILVSTNLKAARYDADNSLLDIKFQDEGIYQYPGVTQDVYDGLINAASPGQYFHRHIKDKYPFRKIS